MSQIIIKTHHVEITGSIKDYVDKKVSKLHQFFDKIDEIHVDLDVETFPNEADRQIASATVFVPGTALIAKEATKDLYASVDGMVDKLQRQLKKYKDKLRIKSRQHAMKTKRTIRRIGESSDTHQTHQKDDASLYIPRPIHVEDAVTFLEENGQSFLVFRNASNEHINVLYVDDDGQFGLIET